MVSAFLPSESKCFGAFLLRRLCSRPRKEEIDVSATPLPVGAGVPHQTCAPLKGTLGQPIGKNPGRLGV